ncbi:MAG: hypothetical protein J6Q78_02225 [Clostridia bacterium]|jgi:hypothetical protein|nr:hypothetical protein [Clostridia bacterium]
MANMNNIKTNVSRVANKAIKKTGELADIASMHLKLKSLEHKLDSKYKDLGKLTYKQLKSGASQAEKIADTIVDIDAIREEIRLQKEKIEAEKQARKERKAAAKFENAENNDTAEATE